MSIDEIDDGFVDKVASRFDELANISETEKSITRTLLSTKMEEAAELLSKWMQDAGLNVQKDEIGNLSAKTQNNSNDILLCGSHYDSVKNAGKFDGPLGIICGISAVEWLKQKNIKLKYDLNVLAFSDEEGVRFHTAYLGSSYFFDQFNKNILSCTDKDGISVEKAFADVGAKINGQKNFDKDKKIIGYFEAHIEQGRVLEEAGLPLAVVESIAGQCRAEVKITGMADHAGNTPMNLRKDALCAVSEFILFAENYAKSDNQVLVTVGKIDNTPNVSNTISQRTIFTIDIRSSDNEKRKSTLKNCEDKIKEICKNRGLSFDFNTVVDEDAVKCDDTMTDIMADILNKKQGNSMKLLSGAGHDAVIASLIAPVSMLFVRCKGGISHHPSEYVSREDLKATIESMIAFFLKINENR